MKVYFTKFIKIYLLISLIYNIFNLQIFILRLGFLLQIYSSLRNKKIFQSSNTVLIVWELFFFSLGCQLLLVNVLLFLSPVGIFFKRKSLMSSIWSSHRWPCIASVAQHSGEEFLLKSHLIFLAHMCMYVWWYQNGKCTEQ